MSILSCLYTGVRGCVTRSAVRRCSGGFAFALADLYVIHSPYAQLTQPAARSAAPRAVVLASLGLVLASHDFAELPVRIACARACRVPRACPRCARPPVPAHCAQGGPCVAAAGITECCPREPDSPTRCSTSLHEICHRCVLWTAGIAPRALMPQQQPLAKRRNASVSAWRMRSTARGEMFQCSPGSPLGRLLLACSQPQRPSRRARR